MPKKVSPRIAADDLDLLRIKAREHKTTMERIITDLIKQYVDGDIVFESPSDATEVQTSFNLDDDLVSRLEAKRKQDGVTVTAVVQRLVHQHVHASHPQRRASDRH